MLKMFLGHKDLRGSFILKITMSLICLWDIKEFPRNNWVDTGAH